MILPQNRVVGIQCILQALLRLEVRGVRARAGETTRRGATAGGLDPAQTLSGFGPVRTQRTRTLERGARFIEPAGAERGEALAGRLGIRLIGARCLTGASQALRRPLVLRIDTGSELIGLRR